MKQIENNDEFVMLEFDGNDKPFKWFWDEYQNGELDGKLVTMDEGMLLRILNSRNCYILGYREVPCHGGIDQTIKIRWKGNNETTAEAEICVHGPNHIVLDTSDGFANYYIKMDDRSWIYFSDVRFVSEYEGSYESRILGEFEYGKNRTRDSQIVHLVYGYQEKLRLKNLQQTIFDSLGKEQNV